MSKAWITDILDNMSHTSWKRSKTHRPTEKLHYNCMGQLVYPQPFFTWVERKNEAKLEFLRWGSANPKNPSCGKTGYFLEERITTTRMAADECNPLRITPWRKKKRMYFYFFLSLDGFWPNSLEYSILTYLIL